LSCENNQTILKLEKYDKQDFFNISDQKSNNADENKYNNKAKTSTVQEDKNPKSISEDIN
jgi:hypothetical protein